MPQKLLPLIVISMMLLIKSALFGNEHVVLLHGLARSPNSMEKMERVLRQDGYVVHNLGYSSRRKPVEALAESLQREIISRTKGAEKVHFVTHSMGGILVRQIQKAKPIANIGRVVMLSPPNNGSEVVDRLGHLRLFHHLNGPAGQQLGTGEDGFVQRLGPVNIEGAIHTVGIKTDQGHQHLHCDNC